MTLTMNIPALLFPAISLTMLAYNARYLAIANLIRELYKEYRNSHEKNVEIQIQILNKRLKLIRATQGAAILSFIGAVLTMFLLFLGLDFVAKFVFVLSLSSMIVSLVLLFVEIQTSTKALQVQLKDMKA